MIIKKQLIFIRHTAHDFADVTGGPHITNQGRDLLQGSLVKFFNENSIVPDRLLISSTNRTVETAQFLKEKLSWQAKLEIVSGLFPYKSGKEFLQQIAEEKFAALKIIICVSHIETIDDIMVEMNEYPVCLDWAEAVIMEFNADNWTKLEAPATTQCLRILDQS